MGDPPFDSPAVNAVVDAVPHAGKRASNVRWIIVAVMSAASFVSYVLRTDISIVGDAIMTDLGLTQVQLGMVFSAFAWGYGLFQFPGGVWADILGSRKSLTIIAVGWFLMTALTGIVLDPSLLPTSLILATLIVIRFLVGVAHAPLFPIVGGTIGNWFPVSRWALPNGLTSAALTLGAAAAAPLVVWLMYLVGWRHSFFLTAPLGILIAVLWWWNVRDFPAEHPGVSRQELDIIDTDRPPPRHAAEEKAVWKLTLRNPNVLLLTASYFCMNYIFYLFFNWFFIYLVDVRGVGRDEAGFLTATQWIVGAVGATLGGYLCDRFAKRYGPRWGYRLLPIPSLILAAGFLMAGAVTRNPYAAVAFLAVCSGLTQVTDSSYWAAIVSVTGRHAAAASGILNTGGNVVGAIGAILVPVTARLFGWTAAMGTGAVFGVVAALLWLLIQSDKPMATR